MGNVQAANDQGGGPEHSHHVATTIKGGVNKDAAEKQGRDAPKNSANAPQTKMPVHCLTRT